MILKITTPVVALSPEAVAGRRVEISGTVYTARDAVIPRLARLIQNETVNNLNINLQGAAIMHAAVSPSGFGPTSSNKEEIESNMGILSQAGVRIHMGKGALSRETVEKISEYRAVYITVPPVSALLQNRLISKSVVAFQEQGMEAMYALEVQGLPGIIAAADNCSLFNP